MRRIWWKAKIEGIDTVRIKKMVTATENFLKKEIAKINSRRTSSKKQFSKTKYIDDGIITVKKRKLFR